MCEGLCVPGVCEGDGATSSKAVSSAELAFVARAGTRSRGTFLCCWSGVRGGSLERMGRGAITASAKGLWTIARTAGSETSKRHSRSEQTQAYSPRMNLTPATHMLASKSRTSEIAAQTASEVASSLRLYISLARQAERTDARPLGAQAL